MSENVQTPPAAAAVRIPASNKRWYVVHAYSGMEKSVERNIDRAHRPRRHASQVRPDPGADRRSRRSQEWPEDITERRFFPGYVLVEMEMDDETWHLVKNTNKVTGFVGGSEQRPTPISQKEVDKIMQQMQEGIEKPRHKVLFEVGELVRVKDGPFTDFNGNVEEVNYEKSKVRVSVTIFGRATPVELEFGQVEKV